ncbi:hypothetical protein BBD39_04570 [Arsenophonus endosymbiont of Bemisia tabaci Asia II 3]|nr:hypothetical protein BBD39_04570 [Arsenophonus endosymbiont of Bemisia tabaci Asia II 3]
MDDSGDSYMVYAASKNRCFLVFGGGSVTLSELEEVAGKGIETKIFPEFLPDPINLDGKLAQGKTMAEICPIQTKYTKEI